MSKGKGIKSEQEVRDSILSKTCIAMTGAAMTAALGAVKVLRSTGSLGPSDPEELTNSIVEQVVAQTMHLYINKQNDSFRESLSRAGYTPEGAVDLLRYSKSKEREKENEVPDNTQRGQNVEGDTIPGAEEASG